jgi:hypothetical protein
MRRTYQSGLERGPDAGKPSAVCGSNGSVVRVRRRPKRHRRVPANGLNRSRGKGSFDQGRKG